MAVVTHRASAGDDRVLHQVRAARCHMLGSKTAGSWATCERCKIHLAHSLHDQA